MKMIVAVALALVALAAAAPAEVPQTLESIYEQTPDGEFKSSFKTENGIDTVAEGALKTVNDADNKPQTVLVLRGSYSYPDKDGQPILVTYVADELGYRAEGNSIPKNTSR